MLWLGRVSFVLKKIFLLLNYLSLHFGLVEAAKKLAPAPTHTPVAASPTVQQREGQGSHPTRCTATWVPLIPHWSEPDALTLGNYLRVPPRARLPFNFHTLQKHSDRSLLLILSYWLTLCMDVKICNFIVKFTRIRFSHPWSCLLQSQRETIYQLCLKSNSCDWFAVINLINLL